MTPNFLGFSLYINKFRRDFFVESRFDANSRERKKNNRAIKTRLITKEYY